jgi:hypothetical protein
MFNLPLSNKDPHLLKAQHKELDHQVAHHLKPR